MIFGGEIFDDMRANPPKLTPFSATVVSLTDILNNY